MRIVFKFVDIPEEVKVAVFNQGARDSVRLYARVNTLSNQLSYFREGETRKRIERLLNGIERPRLAESRLSYRRFSAGLNDCFR